jgi:integrase
MHGPAKRKYLQRLKGGQIYFRVGGKTRARLPDDEASSEFVAQYDALVAAMRAGQFGDQPSRVGRPVQGMPGRALTQTVNGVKRHKPPAIGWFTERWLASDFFASPDKINATERPFRAGTQHNYRLGLNLLRANGMLDVPLLDLNPRTANLYIQKVKRERGGSAAGLQKNLLANIWKFATTLAEFDSEGRGNPMHEREVINPYRLRQEHKPWPDAVQDRFLAACDENLHLAFHLLLCTGQRISDVAKMQWSDFDGAHITLIQKKSRDQEPMRIRAPKILQALLKRRERVSTYMLTHKWRRPYTRDSLTHRIKDTLKAIGEPGYTTHGLRKNAGIMLALNGASVQVIMACLGHKTPKMALYYIRLANQAKLADQGADIMDAVFERRHSAKIAGNRAQIRPVK